MNRYGVYWENKRTEVEKISLPFQTVETINLARKASESLIGYTEQNNEWKNKLIWGDNYYVISSLIPKFDGKIKLIYADPPFFTGTNMSVKIGIGGEETIKEPSSIEELAYRNMWKDGPSSFFQYMYDRFVLMKELLSDDGSIWVRFDSRYVHYIKIILDEIFGYDHFLNEIVINKKRESIGSLNKLEDENEFLLVYTKTKDFRIKVDYKERSLINFKWSGFTKQENRNPRERHFLGVRILPPEGQHFRLVQEKVDKLLKEHFLRLRCVKCKAIFYHDENNSGENFIQIKIKVSKETFKYNDIKPSNKVYGVKELKTCLNCNYDKFKVEYLPSDKIKITNNWKDIPSYSSNTRYPTENSEQLLERVILSGSNPGDLVADFFAGSGTTPVVAEKLGRRWIACDIGRFSIHTIRKRLLDISECKPFEILNLGKYERKYWMEKEHGSVIKRYYDFILQLYNAKPITSLSNIHGILDRKAVHIGHVDYPVTKNEIMEAVSEAKKNNFVELDVLGWEFEMGLNDTIIKEIKENYEIKLNLKKIPTEVMDKRAVDSGDVEFFELAFLETDIIRDNDRVKIKLKNFIIPNPEEIPEEARSKIKKWSDYIDYWSIDWDYNNDIFHNQWQDFRTKKNRELNLESIYHIYSHGKHFIMIKVIDIFGNDTTKIEEVEI